MNADYKEMISELLDYEGELTDTEFIFVNSIKDYSELTDVHVAKLEKLYDKVFGDNEVDTYEIFDEN